MIRHVTAGPRALRAAALRLGLGESAAGWRLDGLCVEGDRGVRVCLKSGSHELSFVLGPEKAGLEGLATPAQMRLLALAAKRLGGGRLAEVKAEIDADPESFVEELEDGEAGDRVRVPYVAGPMSLLEAGWRNFFADQDFDIQMETPEPVPNKTVTIEYADLECFLARPEIDHGKWNFFDWPDEATDPEGTGEGSFVAVELEERDMVMGTGEKADALVSEVKRQSAAGNFLIVTHLCTPIVMGDDFQGLARRCEKEACGTSVNWSQKDRDRRDNFGDHLRSVLGRPGFFDGPGDPGAVNLFHFPARVREAEVRPFLAEIGLAVNISVFPSVDFPSLERLPKARWQVFCEKSIQTDKTLDLMSGFPRPVVKAPAPYGVEGTRACLRAVAAAAGREKEFEAAWGARLAAFLPAWEAGRREAAGYRLAFVVSEATLPRLTALRYGHGAPLATAAREMGFGLDLLYFDRHGRPPRTPAGLEDARVEVFRAPWELERALRDGEFHAVYSDVFFDWRVADAGKARFSSREFEMGLDGAGRSLERLLGICRTPFHRRYARSLARRARRANV
ncbi:MAG: hypothetical protein A2X37_05265 [Elusimicrobia bacterium GWA2_66_18]|nr:MAG: hypothetical protein A2X37_05265 [Elusimicrobia bacterium GWA2_66_18]